MNGLFISGTDTDVGKTLISAALMAAAPANVRYWKPIQTGFPEHCDTATVLKLSGKPQESVLDEGLRFKEPASPHYAARLEKTDITLDSLSQIAKRDDLQENQWVVEGAGGQIGRMRVQRREHAVDGALDQGLLVRLLHIRGAHALEDVAEQVEIFVGGAGVAFLGAQRDGERSGDDRSGERAPEGCDDEFLHGVPALPWGSANQLAGGTGAPSSRTST